MKERLNHSYMEVDQVQKNRKDNFEIGNGKSSSDLPNKRKSQPLHDKGLRNNDHNIIREDQDQDQDQDQKKRDNFWIGNSKGFSHLPNNGYMCLHYNDQNLRQYTWHDGLTLLEVFRVRINQCQGHTSGIISGKVIAQATYYDHQLYNNEYGQFITSSEDGRDCLLLTDPPRESFIVAHGWTLIHLILNWKSQNSSEQEDIISDRAVFDLKCFQKEDKPLIDTLKGDKGIVTATVFYATFSWAVKATVQVMLIDKKNPLVGVYGVVAASNDMISKAAVEAGKDPSDYESVLFLKGWDERVKLTRLQSIPLSRSMVAVPLNSNLIVRAVLRNKKDIGKTYVPPAKLSFPAKPSGMSLLTISHKIQVKVTWSMEFKVPPETSWETPCIDWNCGHTSHPPNRDLRSVTY